SADGSSCNGALFEAVQKRCSGYPLQYIIGKWWLARCEFFVNEDCLIPRPDTESVIEQAVKLLPKNAEFADLCTGSGCIAISVLDMRPDTRADAYELYPKTLELAIKNAAHNGVDKRFCGILGDVTDKNLLGDKKYAAIISNPPYIRRDVVPKLSREVSFEPQAALDGGEDGLDFYRAIVSNFARNLCDDGAFIFEIGYDQADDLGGIATEHGFCCRIVRDLGGNDRVAILWRE
ncbi:MAG: peptide chain release factor N(5)-glutamine methyltransferase, partial [Clostridia bacterium]|nr:peptide chain release factor N(5)-glutamine methyltransferase [Clostridia bacterium]